MIKVRNKDTRKWPTANSTVTNRETIKEIEQSPDEHDGCLYPSSGASKFRESRTSKTVLIILEKNKCRAD